MFFLFYHGFSDIFVPFYGKHMYFTSKKNNQQEWFIYIYTYLLDTIIYINMMIYKGNVGNIIYHLNIYNYNDVCAKPRTLEEWRHDGYMLGINLDLRGMQYPIQWIEYCLGGESMGVWHKKTYVIDPKKKKKPRET